MALFWEVAMSFVRIGSFEAKPAQIPELIRIYENEVQPSMRAEPGNLSACLLQQQGAENLFLVCTAWQTQADAERYESSGQALANVGKLRHTFAGPPKLVTYDGYGG
jgi:quinol monooxygenase YgiN